MSVEAWLFAAGTHLVLCVVPGPAVVFVLGESMTRGFRGGVHATAGVVLANAAYFCLAAGGLGGLLIASPPLFAAARWFAAGYLTCVGVQMFRASRFGTGLVEPTTAQGQGASSLLRGFGVQLANPKAPVFFLVFLPGLLDVSSSLVWQVVVVGVPLFVIQAVTLIGYAFTAEGLVNWLGHTRARVAVGRIAGTLLVAFGLIVAAMTHISQWGTT
ncbi:MAG: LysE family translocator [Acidobacteria bacterium]|nr:LysE family translocator [Acidobacteriota bacterium]